MAGIPAFNEEKYIAKVILKTRRHVNEIIVVNDGSSDMTGEIARALGATVIDHPKNLGYGAAIRSILEEAKKRNPDVVVILDGDDQHDPDEIPKLIKPILEGKADIVIGSRFLGRSEQPFWRRLGVKLITWLLKKSSSLPPYITDAQSGFRAYSNKALHAIKLKDNNMAVSIEILVQAMDHKLNIEEVPITIKYHKDSSTHNPLVHGAILIIKILRLFVERRLKASLNQ